MSNAAAIVAIVKDPALLRSISFLLNSHGHCVERFQDWVAAAETARSASFVILDSCLSETDLSSGLELLQDGVRIVVLAEKESSLSSGPGLQVLMKPLGGADIADALEALSIIP